MPSGSTEDEQGTRDIQCFLTVMVRIILKEQEGFEGMLRPCFKTTFQYKAIN